MDKSYLLAFCMSMTNGLNELTNYNMYLSFYSC